MLVNLITAKDPAIRNRSLDDVCAAAPLQTLLGECAELDAFRRQAVNLYERVRALFFLYAIYRFHLPVKAGLKPRGLVPFKGYEQLLDRRFEEAIDIFLNMQRSEGPSDGLSSALAAAYQRLGFQTLGDQVRRSVRSVRGNQWMFRMGHPADQPLRVRPELTRLSQNDGTYPILREQTPVRMDLTHCGWSDIFFLGMDFPEGAKVLNVSIDLGVFGRDPTSSPPISAYLRVIDEPVLRLTSVDLGATADISELAEVFDFAKDYLGLLKAAVIASGVVPPGIEGSGHSLSELLARIVGTGKGIEIVSSVNNIPKGSRLAVSTNLLAALISVCMRATGQTTSLAGPLGEPERRLVLARAILGEWLGGSGGGWQDSGGVWPGIKLIQGVWAAEGDAEYGISRGCLMPRHEILGPNHVAPEVRERLQQSLILVHGGMAQNVGPILEMVTEKYLLRSPAEWKARMEALSILDNILKALQSGDVRAVGANTTNNFEGPLRTIIPWASNSYTETLIDRVRGDLGDNFWGFWMLGGMSGGGMGFMVAPEQKKQAQERVRQIMLDTKAELEHALPFAMEPVIYDFAINEAGTTADLLQNRFALMGQDYYTLILPQLVRQQLRDLPPSRRAELDKFGTACRLKPELRGVVQTLFDRLLPRQKTESESERSVADLLERYGFDRAQHDEIRANLKNARIGLAQNRLPPNADIRDIDPGDVLAIPERASDAQHLTQLGLAALRGGSVAVLTLAAGAGTRWTQGAGVVKALHPFCRFAGRHRTFLEVHIAKTRRMARISGTPAPHVFSTSYLSHAPISQWLQRNQNYGYAGRLLLSPARAVGLRLVPMVRDLRFMWEEMPHQMLDERAEKVRDSTCSALVAWARQTGEATDYTDNVPLQCVHPVGHWYEVPNFLRNGTLRSLLEQRPQIRHLLLHNIDTLGADLDPALLGLHIHERGCLTFEVITRRVEDRGGGLARVNGALRLVEGLAMPREEAEFDLSYYNTMTTWIDLDQYLSAFGLTRDELHDEQTVATAIRRMASKMPTYITLKDVKKRWGHGQEDVFPVTQFEKLWGDMTTLPDVSCKFVAVSRVRGQQLKDQAQLDGWLRDGSAAYVESICDWK